MISRKISSIIAGFLLALMFVLMFFSAWNESATMDELAHIPAGYSYLTQKDYRLNPEHPPLIKDLAALPLLFLNINFPADHSSWKNDVNGQWSFGSVFLYESGNDADKIIRLARLPIMLLTILFGWLFFRWIRRRYGDQTGLLALFFFVFSPTFIAHGRYVTTDIAAAFGFFLGLTVFIKFLEHDAIGDRRWKYLFIAGIIFGLIQLLKFSLFMLVPLYLLLGVLWVFVYHWEDIKFKFSWKEKIIHLLKEESKIIGKIIIISFIGLLVVWVFYSFHTWNYPPERQARDADFILNSFKIKPLAKLNVFLSNNSFFQPLAEYLLGLLMVIQRAAGGNNAYFLGQISANGWWYYFPVAYLLKEQLAFHLLTFLALVIGIKYVYKSVEKSLTAVIEWSRDNFILTTSFIFITVYWTQSLTGNLNIGVRHILPTFPFIFLLVSRELVKWAKYFTISDPQNFGEWLRSLYEKYIAAAPKYILLTIFFLWILIEAVIAFPYYLSYYNELAGGPMNGHRYIVDSNYDWGQDLKRLKDFTDEAGLDKINLDYFGGGSPKYYLGEKFKSWESAKGAPVQGEWLAVSATILNGAQAEPAKRFIRNPQDSYQWLKNKKPIARAGTSIFIYKF